MSQWYIPILEDWLRMGTHTQRHIRNIYIKKSKLPKSSFNIMHSSIKRPVCFRYPYVSTLYVQVLRSSFLLRRTEVRLLALLCRSACERQSSSKNHERRSSWKNEGTLECVSVLLSALFFFFFYSSIWHGPISMTELAQNKYFFRHVSIFMW